MIVRNRSLKKLIKKENIPFILLFSIGFLIMIYPMISNLYYQTTSVIKIEKFDNESELMAQKELEKRMNLARAYNSTLSPSLLHDAFSKKEKKAGVEAYAKMLELEEMIGHVELPGIYQDLPIYAGTSDSVLERGAGHLEGSSLPIGGPGTHTVITAHRGLPEAQLFRNLDKLKKGDVFYIRNIKETLAYEVDQILVVAPTDFKPVMVMPNKDYATLLTCTPYMINSHRLLVRGHRIPYNSLQHDKDVRDMWKSYLPYVLVLFVLISYGSFLVIRKKIVSHKAKV